MKRFLAFVKKEFYHILRDRRTLLILFGMPIVQVILFGFAITNEITNARIAICDPAKDEMTNELTQRLLSSGYFLLDENLESYKDIEENFKEGKTKLAIAYDPSFQKRFYTDKAQVQLISDATDPNTGTTLINYAAAIFRDFQMEKMGATNQPTGIQTEVKMLFNPRLKSVFMFVPGVMTVILMLVSAMMTSIAITREKELGTMEILMVTPLKPFVIIVGKVVPYIFLAFLNALIILALGAFVFEMPVRGSLPLLLSECVLFVVTSLALGILISTKTQTQQVAMMISLMALMLPTIILSGFIFPIESMPLPLQWLSNVIPARWFIVILKNIMLKGVGFAFVWKETAILLLMTLILIGVSVRNFKIRLD